MFNLIRRRLDPREQKINSVYQMLEVYERRYRLVGLRVRYRKIVSRELCSSLLDLSSDAETTVHLIRILQQRQLMEGLETNIDHSSVVRDIGSDAARKDAIEQCESVKSFCEEIKALVDTGHIKKTLAVERFVSENVSALMQAGARYLHNY